jgi:hypothetical protein
VGTPIGTGFRSVNVTLRRALDLYACVRPVRSLKGVPARYEGVDLVIIRENTEGLYSGIEHMVVPGVAESLKIVTERACQRITEFAFATRAATGAQARHRGAQGQHHEAHRRDVPRRGAARGAALSRHRDPRGSSSTRAPCSWCETPRASTCW